MGDDSVPVTEEFIESGKSPRGGWTREQLRLLGVSWPPPKGWKQGVLGVCIPKATAEEFVRLRKGGHEQGTLF